MNNRIWPLAFCCALGACATSSQPVYVEKPGMTEAEYQRDMAQCEMQEIATRPAFERMPMPGLAAARHYNEVMDACLRSKGYTVRR